MEPHTPPRPSTLDDLVARHHFIFGKLGFLYEGPEALPLPTNRGTGETATDEEFATALAKAGFQPPLPTPEERYRELQDLYWPYTPEQGYALKAAWYKAQRKRDLEYERLDAQLYGAGGSSGGRL